VFVPNGLIYLIDLVYYGSHSYLDQFCNIAQQWHIDGVYLPAKKSLDSVTMKRVHNMRMKSSNSSDDTRSQRELEKISHAYHPHVVDNDTGTTNRQLLTLTYETLADWMVYHMQHGPLKESLSSINHTANIDRAVNSITRRMWKQRAIMESDTHSNDLSDNVAPSSSASSSVHHFDKVPPSINPGVESTHWLNGGEGTTTVWPVVTSRVTNSTEPMESPLFTSAPTPTPSPSSPTSSSLSDSKRIANGDVGSSTSTGTPKKKEKMKKAKTSKKNQQSNGQPKETNTNDTSSSIAAPKQKKKRKRASTKDGTDDTISLSSSPIASSPKERQRKRLAAHLLDEVDQKALSMIMKHIPSFDIHIVGHRKQIKQFISRLRLDIKKQHELRHDDTKQLTLPDLVNRLGRFLLKYNIEPTNIHSYLKPTPSLLDTPSSSSPKGPSTVDEELDGKAAAAVKEHVDISDVTRPQHIRRVLERLAARMDMATRKQHQLRIVETRPLTITVSTYATPPPQKLSIVGHVNDASGLHIGIGICESIRYHIIGTW
jgi:hypothetical protein